MDDENKSGGVERKMSRCLLGRIPIVKIQDASKEKIQNGISIRRMNGNNISYA